MSEQQQALRVSMAANFLENMIHASTRSGKAPNTHQAPALAVLYADRLMSALELEPNHPDLLKHDPCVPCG